MRKQLFSLIFSLIIIFCPVSRALAKSALGETGDLVQMLLPFGAGICSIAKQDKLGIKQLIYTSAITTAVMGALKVTVNERRPNGGHHSFPSGHTTISFASSTYLWKRYGPEYGIPASLLAGFVGYSRVKTKAHYLHDVLAGAALGIGVSLLVTTKYEQNVSISPKGVSVKFSF